MSEDRALRSILKHFNVSAGELYLGGRTLRSVSDDVGTPFFIYDLSVAQEKYNSLRNALPEGVETYYAVKANPDPVVLDNLVAGQQPAELSLYQNVGRSLATSASIWSWVRSNPSP